MPTPPNWLLWISAPAAAISALIAIAALVVAMKTYRRAGASIRTAFVVGRAKYKSQDIAVVGFYVRNRGLAPTTVTDIRLTRAKFFEIDVEDYTLLAGPTLPYRLDGGSQNSWYFHVRNVSVCGDIVGRLDEILDSLRYASMTVIYGGGIHRRSRYNYHNPPEAIDFGNVDKDSVAPTSVFRKWSQKVVDRIP